MAHALDLPLEIWISIIRHLFIPSTFSDARLFNTRQGTLAGGNPVQYEPEASIFSLSMVFIWRHCRPVCRRLQAATEATFATELLACGAEVRIPWIRLPEVQMHRFAPPSYHAPVFTLSTLTVPDDTITFRLIGDSQDQELADSWRAFCRVYREGSGFPNGLIGGSPGLFAFEGVFDVICLPGLRLDHSQMAITVAWKLLISGWCGLYNEYLEDINAPTIRSRLGLHV